jgi:acyl-CoA reductase-like NAD-dependent aldehyde dehydrogenase
VGEPFAAGIRLGPLISSVQRDRVRGYIQNGKVYQRRVRTKAIRL